MRWLWTAIAGAVGVWLMGGPAHAGTFVAMDLPELVTASEAVVMGEVIGITSRWTPDKRVIVSDVTIDIERSIVGELYGKVEVLTFGGQVGDYVVQAPGSPTFEVGKDVVVFLERHPDQSLRVTGYQLGLYEVQELNGQRAVVPTLDDGTHLLGWNGEPQVRPVAAELGTFTRAVRKLAFIGPEVP